MANKATKISVADLLVPYVENIHETKVCSFVRSSENVLVVTLARNGRSQRLYTLEIMWTSLDLTIWLLRELSSRVLKFCNNLGGFPSCEIPPWYPTTLPIATQKTALLRAVREHHILILSGETGSGKTTQLPQYLAQDGYCKTGKIACSLPRRVAVISAATRASMDFGCEVGQFVGYSVRFDDKTSPATRITYMTEGVLLKIVHSNPLLCGYSSVIIDEAHERNLNTDILLAHLKNVSRKRPELRIVIMSAFFAKDVLHEYFGSAHEFSVPGQTYPIEMSYGDDLKVQNIITKSLDIVMQIHHHEPHGDILLFLTGQSEITLACHLVKKMITQDNSKSSLNVVPLYSALHSESCSAAFRAGPLGSRKLIIATNIAETSLTIPGVVYVIDPGYTKTQKYNWRNDSYSFEIELISRAQATQRAGRVGRTGKGKVYRLFSEQTYFKKMEKFMRPEILRVNLASTVLQIKSTGFVNVELFDFPTPPLPGAILSAIKQLQLWSALDDCKNITKLGYQMATLPLEPLLAKTLISSVKLNCSYEISIIVAMLSENSIFLPRLDEKRIDATYKRKNLFKIGGDLLTFLNIYREWAAHDYTREWCINNFINPSSMENANAVTAQLQEILRQLGLEIKSCGQWSLFEIQNAICAGFFLNAAIKDSVIGYQTLLDHCHVFIHPSSSLFDWQPELILFHRRIFQSGRTYVMGVTEIDEECLLKYASPTIRTTLRKTLLATRRKFQKRKQWICPKNAKYSPE